MKAFAASLLIFGALTAAAADSGADRQDGSDIGLAMGMYSSGKAVAVGDLAERLRGGPLPPLEAAR